MTVDLGADSLDFVSFIQAAEAEFGLEVSDDDATGMATIGQIVDHLFARRGEFGSCDTMVSPRGPGGRLQGEDWDDE